MTDPHHALTLAARARQLYETAKLNPESTPAGRIALIEIRNMLPDLCTALEELARDRAEWFEPPRLD